MTVEKVPERWRFESHDQFDMEAPQHIRAQLRPFSYPRSGHIVRSIDIDGSHHLMLRTMEGDQSVKAGDEIETDDSGALRAVPAEKMK